MATNKSLVTVSVSALVIGVAAFLMALPAPKSLIDESRPKTADIHCPFLKMISPDTSSLWKFTRDCSNNGVQYSMALFLGVQAVWKQQGLYYVLMGYAPDIWRLDQVEGASHPDRYNPYKEETKKRLEAAMDKDGMVTLQVLVDIKKWIAQQEECEINTASEGEISLLFIKAGGNLETQKVSVKDALDFLEGNPTPFPKGGAYLDWSKFRKCSKMAKW